MKMTLCGCLSMNARRALCLALLPLALNCAPAVASGDVVGTIGQRSLNHDFWGEVDRQPVIGVLADFGVGRGVPLFFAVGVQGSSKDADASDGSGNTISGAVVDVTFGLKVMPAEGSFRPYFSAGGASVAAAGRVEGAGFTTDYDDQSFGYYVAGGVLFAVTDHLVIGGDVRWIGGTEIRFGNDTGDADSLAAVATIGWGW